MNALVLHKGANRVSYEELAKLEAPPATDTWKPVRHQQLLDVTTDTLGQMGFNIHRMELAVAEEGHRFFATLDLRHEIGEGVSLAVGLRNSTDKSISAGLCAGERTFVCDNLAFNSEIAFHHKHTVNIEETFHVRTVKAVLSLRQYAEVSKKRIEAMQARTLSDVESDSLLLRSYEKNIVGARLLPQLIKEWREPSYEEFKPRNLFSFWNCYSHVLKDRQTTNPISASQDAIRFSQLIAV